MQLDSLRTAIIGSQPLLRLPAVYPRLSIFLAFWYAAWYGTPLGAFADAREKEAVFALAGVRPGERALDVGCGTGNYTLALARAVASLPVLLEHTLPLLRVGGWLIAQKGKPPQEELATAQGALQRLGGRLARVLPVTVPGLNAECTLVLVEKVTATPATYPPPTGVPQKQPLK